MDLKQTLLNKISRRRFIRLGLGGALGVAGAGLFGRATLRAQDTSPNHVQKNDRNMRSNDMTHGNMSVVGKVDASRNGFDPLQILVDWDYGRISKLPDGQTLREYEFVALDKEIEIAPGIFFPAWTYNGRVPGPTIRCTEGDRIRIHFINEGTHPHTIHFHGIHPFEMDGVPGAGPGMIGTGESFTFEFDA
jgi:FtsP/CotA-like multicopper oxidase with cupredoxin domain